jgi:hypothetical protein
LGFAVITVPARRDCVRRAFLLGEGDFVYVFAVHEARLVVNRLRRPWGDSGATPERRWMERNALPLDERQNMWQEIERRRAQLREARGIDARASLPHYAQAEIDRDAASPVLTELGYYQVKRRRFTSAN